MSPPSSRRTSNKGISPALSLFLLSHTQLCAAGSTSQHLRLLGPHPISCLDGFKSLLNGLPASSAPLTPPLVGELSEPQPVILTTSPNLETPHSRRKPRLFSLGFTSSSLYHTAQPTTPIPCFFLPPSLRTALSDARNAFPAAPTPAFIPRLFFFVPPRKSPSCPEFAPISELLHT